MDGYYFDYRSYLRQEFMDCFIRDWRFIVEVPATNHSYLVEKSWHVGLLKLIHFVWRNRQTYYWLVANHSVIIIIIIEEGLQLSTLSFVETMMRVLHRSLDFIEAICTCSANLINLRGENLFHIFLVLVHRLIN